MNLKPLLMTLALTASTAVLAAAPQYTTEVVTLNAKAGSSYLGKLTVATPVTVLKKQGANVQVRVSGWTLADFPSQIFSKPGVRIEYGSFDEETAVKVDPATGVDVAGNKWVKATIEGWMPAKALTKDINGLWKQGKARLGDACSSCHGAPDAGHFTANQWASTLPERGGRTGHTRAGANALMFKYLQEHAKK